MPGRNDRRVSFFTRDPDDLRVLIEGHIEDHPFAADINVSREEATYIPHHMVASDIGSPSKQPPQKTAKETKKGCPGCHSTLKKLIRGGMGWAKELLHLGQAEQSLAEHRKGICLRCPSGCYDFGVCRDDLPDRAAEEQGCGCILALKVTQADQECPHKHW